MKKSTSASTIKTSELANLTGLTSRWLSELSTRGDLPKPRRGEYPWPLVLRKLIGHYQNVASRAKLDPLQNVKRLLLEDKLAVLRRELIPADDLQRDCARMILATKARIMALGDTAKIEFGLSDEHAETLRRRVREACAEMSSKLWISKALNG